MPLRNVATTFTIEQQRLEINALAGDVNNIATGATNVGSATTASALAAGATGEDLTLSGTLTVNGTQTILNTATLEVEDKNIVIAKGSTTDAAASGGGITLKGANDKTILYNQTGDQWEFNKSVTVAGNIQFTQATPELEFNNGGARLTAQAANSLSVHSGGGQGTADNEVARFTTGKVTIGNDHAGAATWDGNLVVANTNGGRISVGDTGSGERFDIAANGDINLYSYLNGDHINFHTTDGSGTFNRLRIQSNGNVVIPSGYLQIDPSDHDKLKLKVPSGSSDDWAYMTFWGEDGNRNAYVGTNAAGDVKVSRDGGCNLELGQNAIFNATVLPSADNTQNLGSTTKRWANVYTGDMHLNNMNTGGNDVDGSEGHWTMQEGANDLFLINRNTGKKYKFNLTEVS